MPSDIPPSLGVERLAAIDLSRMHNTIAFIASLDSGIRIFVFQAPLMIALYKGNS